ncbi:MAG: acetylxylan esterase [Bacillota bacterium]|nr:acetylxylan esterase [Bacillota bacterium]
MAVDMPLTSLNVYQGINPKPEDHAAYWEIALQEMRAVDPQVEIVPSSFQSPGAECFHLYFTGVRNARIHAKYLRPKTASPQEKHPAILVFHGYSSDSGEWSDKLKFVQLGFSVAALECRGQGGLSEDTGGVTGNTLHGHMIRGLSDKPENLLFRHIFLDAAQLAGIIMQMPEVDEKRVGALGNSQGGALTLACAALEPRIRKAAPAYPGLCDFQRSWEMNQNNELRNYFRWFDPEHKNEKEIFTKLGYIDVQHLVDRIEADVFMGTALNDNVCLPSTQFAAYNKIQTPKKMAIFPDFAHEGLPGFPDQVFMYMAEL